MREWRYKIDIKSYIKDEDSAQVVATNVLAEVKSLMQREAFKGDIQLDEIIQSFKDLSEDPEATDKAFNEVLEQFYDWADDNDVWTGL